MSVPTPLPKSADKSNSIEDLSGVDTTAFANPYDALIDASGNDTVKPIFLSHNGRILPECPYLLMLPRI